MTLFEVNSKCSFAAFKLHLTSPLILLLLLASAPALSQGNIEREEADEMIRTYMRKVVSRQPSDIRHAWKGNYDKVRLNEHDLYGFVGIDGSIYFEYFPDSKTLDCLSTVHKFRKIVHPWVYRALKEAEAAGESTGGFELIYDPVSTGIFIRHKFTEGPLKQRKFRKTCDAVTRIGEYWFREAFLEAVKAFYARHAPPASARGMNGPFEAILLLAEDETAFLDVWDRPATAREPEIWTLDRVAVDRQASVYTLFRDCKPDAADQCRVSAALELVRPDGGVVVKLDHVPLWAGPAPAPGHLQPGVNSLGLGFEGEPPGTYHMRGQVCDEVASLCVALSLPWEVVLQQP